MNVKKYKFMRDKLGDRARLLHIHEAIAEIEQYIANTDLAEFENNSMRRLATIKQLEIIGEAVSRLSDDILERYPHIEWRKIKGLRNILVHEYFGVDTVLIWQIVQKDLPAFKESIQNIPDIK